MVLHRPELSISTSEHYNESKDIKQTVARFWYSYILLFYQDVKCCWMKKVYSFDDSHVT